ncbi:hypothetical protein Rsub_05641 [Raphidocelis subcapitata]|uniref:Major facilitator superfamily (MFS) profile domain-containing protein n=1 Tax=Raphidocelis subcapitata TaxID=307507 RepID=A0A2V0P5A3_9CHLO|nr:hypothetical protein Rsub_05641 [Raphidocelis subcapitata]|eukprot:GBF93030.1 hypothetical protein Rsub_05641 [Raphidocelis subcapitata]
MGPAARVGSVGPAELEPLAQEALRRTSFLVIPLIGAASFMMALDRGNLAFAATQMNADLKFDATTYGLAAGIFYAALGPLQVPSAAVGMRVGMRWWLGFITIGWGVVATCTSLVNTAGQLYLCRLLLGAFEAGAAPAMYHILAAYYPTDRLAKPYSAIFVGGQLSLIVSAPLSAALLTLDGVRGLDGWRWLLLIEGLPSILLGLAIWAALPADPLSAWWLPAEQREALHQAVHGAEMADEARVRPSLRKMWATLVATVRQPVAWALTAAGVLWVMCSFSLGAWVPILISNLLNGTALSSATAVGGGKAKSVQATLLSTVPFVTATFAVLANAWHSDRTRERTAHIAVPNLVGGVLLACFGAVARRSVAGGFAIITLSLACAFATQSVFVARAAAIMPASQTAISVGLLNAVCAGLGGFLGPVVTGAVVRQLHSFEFAALAMASVLLASSLILFGVLVWERRGGGGDGSKGKGNGGGSGGGGGGDGKAPDGAGGSGDLEMPRR